MKKIKVMATALGAVAVLAVPGAAQAKSHHHPQVRDRNHDGLPDKWEKRHHLSLAVKQATRDQDKDGLNNRGEFKADSNPRDADTDNDGVNDGNEVGEGTNPADVDTNDDGVNDGQEG